MYSLFHYEVLNRFYVSFAYSANEFDKGNVRYDVFLPEIPETPVFSYERSGSCDDLKGLEPDLECPIEANGKIN